MGILGSVLKDIFAARSGSAERAEGISQFNIEPRQSEGGSILCFTAGSEGNALAILTREVLTPLEGSASRILVFDLNQPGWQAGMYQALEEPVWFAVSYFSVGQDFNIERDGSRFNLWESAGIPFLRFFSDLPAYFPDRHLPRFRNSINAYSDPTNVAFYHRWFRDRALTVHLPPLMLDTLPLEKVDIDRKLGGKIIFPKNGNSPGNLIDYWRTQLPRTLSKALEDIGEECCGREWIDREPGFDDHLIRYFSALGVDIASERALLCYMVAQLDDYLRRIKSTMIAEALLDLPVIIRGRFWEHVNFKGKRATYDPNSDMASTQPLIDQAPAIIDMSPNTQHTPHDRVCRAVGRGTAFLTNKQEVFGKLLSRSERFTFAFERENIQRLVEHYIAHPREAVELGLEQSRAFREAYPSENFAKAITATVHAMAFRLGARPQGTQNFVDFPPTIFR